MTNQFDIVVAGGGHNSLVTAAYMAKAGYSCVVLEAHSVIGGNATTEEITLPGFQHDTCSTAHAIFMESPIWRNQELPLAEYGLEYVHVDPASHVMFPDGSYITQWIDIDRTCEEIAKFSRKDADTYRKMIAEWRSVAPIFNKIRYTPIGWDSSVNQVLTSHPQGAIWMRRQALSAWDIIDAAFEDWHVKSWMLWFAEGTLQPAERAGTGLLAYSFVAGRQRSGWAIPKGGSGKLTSALGRIIEDHGGTVLTNQPVSRLMIENGRCVGVETERGEQFRARHAVVSTIHVKHLVNMAPAEAWGDSFLYGVETYKAGRSMFVAHYATTEPPRFAVNGGSLSVVAAGIAQTDERQLRVAEDFNRGIVASDDPVLLILTPSLEDPSRVPEGKHTLKIINVQPYSLRDGAQKWDEIKEQVAANNLEHLRRYAPNLTNDKILATEIRSPLDLERHNRHNWHGNCHGGDQSASQTEALRPVPGYAQHRMPIPGLYQTGATTHPGGSVTGAPGRNAAMVLLKDLGRDLNGIITVS
ncbi:MAG TPA: NAD(P)/FAD-dependent oxidoreductase [Ktedonobacteraceae bacterium]|nr:NAD(P)/FAD-dependent oxidoreductase [Ktedonobacteraceae bacterium]